MGQFILSLSRILLSLVFAFTGYSKVVGYAGVQDMAKWKERVKGLKIPGTNDPLPNPDLLAQIVAYGELVGGIMLFIGILSRVTAFGLFVFTIIASVLGHAFWMQMGDPAMAAQAFGNIGQFLKNMGIAGGLLLIIAAGGGSVGIDAMFRRSA
jgi:putative oxidoreductase